MPGYPGIPFLLIFLYTGFGRPVYLGSKQSGAPAPSRTSSSRILLFLLLFPASSCANLGIARLSFCAHPPVALKIRVDCGICTDKLGNNYQEGLSQLSHPSLHCLIYTLAFPPRDLSISCTSHSNDFSGVYVHRFADPDLDAWSRILEAFARISKRTTTRKQILLMLLSTSTS